ncbi:hypothetical protein ACOSQ3_005128 [Xanthoceras sorbifolium]
MVVIGGDLSVVMRWERDLEVLWGKHFRKTLKGRELKNRGRFLIVLMALGGGGVSQHFVSSCPVVEESLSDQIQEVVMSKEEQIAENLSRMEFVSIVNKEVPEGISNVFLYEGAVSNGISYSNRNVLVVEDNLVLK